MGDGLQVTIAALGLVAALITLAASVLEVKGSAAPNGKAGGNGSPHGGAVATATPRGSRKRAGWLFAAALVLAALSVVAPYVVLPVILPDRPMADIRSPKSGERIGRPQAVDVHLNKAVAEGETVWLGYQNEKGGPYVIQASRCQAIEERLDCGPLYVGRDEKDTAEFRVFLATADASATARLGQHALTAKPGDNKNYEVLPIGTKLISEERHITLVR
jgi:hypothetical protein